MEPVVGVETESVGGGRGIRTPERVTPLTVFKTAAFNHSAIPPKTMVANSAAPRVLGSGRHRVVGQELLGIGLPRFGRSCRGGSGPEEMNGENRPGAEWPTQRRGAVLKNAFIGRSATLRPSVTSGASRDGKRRRSSGTAKLLSPVHEASCCACRGFASSIRAPSRSAVVCSG